MVVMAETQKGSHWEFRTSITEWSQNSTVLHTKTAFTSKIFKHSLTKTEILRTQNLVKSNVRTQIGANPTRKSNSFAHRQGKKQRPRGCVSRPQDADNFFECKLIAAAARTQQISPSFFPKWTEDFRTQRGTARMPKTHSVCRSKQS